MELPLLLLSLFTVCVLVYLFRSRSLRLPPGPPGYPVIGNIYDIPGEREWIKYWELSKQYNSDIIYLNMFGTSVYVLNSYQAADDLFEKRSAIYADRPRFAMLNELVGFSWHFAFMGYNDSWKSHRALFKKEFQPPASLAYNPHMLDATRTLLQRLIETPHEFNSHLRHMAGTIILSTAYGITPLPSKDPYVDISERALAAMAAGGNAGAFLVDSLPWLKHIPGDWDYKQKAREWSKPVLAMPKLPMEFVKKSMKDGTAKSSIASRNLQEMEDEGSWSKEKEEVLTDVLGAMYAAGADTTVSALGTFILAMVLYPDVQKKAQAAVDAAIGSDRLPDFSDERKIPYIDAVLKEVLRWKPVTPLAIVHSNVVDDEYKGYDIPKGSVIIGNAWAMLYDTEMYGPDPEVFRPERFLKNDNTLNPDVRHPDAAFGFGRRVCAGQNMAESSVWMTMASILASFNIVKAVDSKGVPIVPSADYTSGLLCYPKPFKCEIKPRSQAAIERIKESITM